MANLRVKDDPKLLREALCRAQNNVGTRDTDRSWVDSDQRRIWLLISAIDRHRPIGPDGKHGDRHTLTCGCDVSWWTKVRAVLRKVVSA